MKVGVLMPASIDDSGDFVANVRALDAAGVDVISLQGDGGDHAVLLGAIAGATFRARLLVPAGGPADVLGKVARGRVLGETEGGWVSVPVPPDRTAWTATLQEQERAGAEGVLVPWDPRLIDLLRNPEPDDRGDLLMSTG